MHGGKNISSWGCTFFPWGQVRVHILPMGSGGGAHSSHGVPENRPVEHILEGLYCVETNPCGRTDRETDMPKSIGALCDNRPKQYRSSLAYVGTP